ncbi:hypothetical protein MKJ04_11895 [Pontibacter sp. E15-1]|uniref:hypothetical protein n=1 Tax=Pontibacter sp. E15-1 TaxID=2919918 RepID=UPI001F4F9F73|nr:hypothetical protein [Pontibacter sp. E15-1]MCJ8165543.1 hypothetical protein [Pontibacter sp. E15-1]
MERIFLETLVLLDTSTLDHATRKYPAEYSNEFNEFTQSQAKLTGSLIPTVTAFEEWLFNVENQCK